MRELAQARVRFGHCRLRVLLLREGWTVGTEPGASIASTERRAWPCGANARGGTRPRSTASSAGRPRHGTTSGVWTSCPDELTDGRRFRTLTVLDVYTRQCLDLAVGRHLTGQDVAATLERLRFDRGLPQRIYCDNGSEFVGGAMDLWA